MLFSFIEYCFFIVSIFVAILPSCIYSSYTLGDVALLSFIQYCFNTGERSMRWEEEHDTTHIKNNHLLISFDIDYVLESHKWRLLGNFYGSFEIICCFLHCATYGTNVEAPKKSIQVSSLIHQIWLKLTSSSSSSIFWLFISLRFWFLFLMKSFLISNPKNRIHSSDPTNTWSFRWLL